MSVAFYGIGCFVAGFWVAACLLLIFPANRMPAFALRKLIDFYQSQLRKRSAIEAKTGEE